jgi:hypothetical protein
LQLFANAMKKHRHVDLRHTEHARDLRVRVAFKKPERENLSRPRIQGRERPPQAIPQFTLISSSCHRIFKRYASCLLPGPHDVERNVDRCAPKVAFRIFEWVSRAIAPQKSQENRLEYVLRIGRISRNPVRGAKYKPVAFLEDSLDLSGDRSCRCLSDREFQGNLLLFTHKDRISDLLLQRREVIFSGGGAGARLRGEAAAQRLSQPPTPPDVRPSIQTKVWPALGCGRLS